QGIAGPGRAWMESVVLLLEQQYAGAEDVMAGQLVAQSGRHRPQVPHHDQRVVAPGYQYQQPHQLYTWTIDNGALVGGAVGGYHPEPFETHDVIDAHATGISEVGAQHFDKGAETVATHSGGRKCRDTPVLPLAVEEVGRGADADRGQELFLVRP